MAACPLIVFDVNETLLDLQTIEPVFERIFGDKRAMRLWFANFIMYSAALTVAGFYEPFTDIGAAVMKMLADIEGIKNGALELLQIACRRLARDGVLAIGIQDLVRVQLRAVGGQIEHLALRGVLGQPRAHAVGAREAQIVQDQDHLTAGVADQAGEKADHDRGLDGAAQHHPGQLALAGHRREQAQFYPPVAGAHGRRVAARRVRTAADILTAPPSFVAPEDRTARAFGLGGDGRIVLLQPALDFLRALLTGAAHKHAAAASGR
jgi:hypothetical protein